MSELESAAEALVRAACLDVKTRSDTEGVKKTVDAINSVATKVDKLKESCETNLNTVNQNVSEIRQELGVMKKDGVALLSSLDALKNEMVDTKKMQALEFAFHNANYNSFQYYLRKKCPPDQSKESASFVKTIILSFRRGVGRYLPDNAYIGQGASYYEVVTEDKKKAFREALVNQVGELIGKQPVVKLEQNNQYAIYYS